MVYVVGSRVGLPVGGVAGIPGPPVILCLYGAAAAAAQVIRANITDVLRCSSTIIMLLAPLLALSGQFDQMSPLMLGVCADRAEFSGQSTPALLIFNPAEWDTAYTAGVAYLIIGGRGGVRPAVSER